MLPKTSQPIIAAKVLDIRKKLIHACPRPLRLTYSRAIQTVHYWKSFFGAVGPRPNLRSWRMNPGSLEEGLAAAWHVALASGEEVRFPLFSDTEIQLPITDDDSSRLALGPVANFCGAYVDNAFSERQETWIELHQSGLSSQSPIRFTSTETLQERKPLPSLAKRSEREWWFETNLKIPFLHSLGFDASFDEHTILVFPLLRQKQLKTLNGWIMALP